MATDKPRFTITLDTELLDRVHAYKEKNGISTQSKAIQRLIEAGIAETKEQNASPAERDIFVTQDEEELVSIYRSFNRQGKATLLATARGFAGNPAMKEEKRSSETA